MAHLNFVGPLFVVSISAAECVRPDREQYVAGNEEQAGVPWLVLD